MSIARGTPPDKAIGTGAASFLAGSATTGALAALGLVSGPPGWIAMGAGIVVGAGVGYLVDHYWDDLADFVNPD